MSQPPPYAPSTAFVSYQGQQSWFPGQQLDAEFNNLDAIIGDIEANLALIQRDDGALANGSVTYNSLSPTLQTAGLSPLSAWSSGTVYSVPQAVIVNSSLYQCAVANTGTTFAADLAAGYWTLLANLSFISGSTVESANTVAAGPISGSAAAPTFRALIGTDLPVPSATTLGGIQSLAAVAHNFLTGISTAGAVTQAQPAFTDVSGTAGLAQGGTNANLSATGGTSQVLKQVSTGAAVTVGQLAFTDVSGTATVTQGGTGSNLSATGGASQVLKQITAGAAVTVAQLATTDISGITAYASAAVGQLPGTATNDSAAAGKIGEIASSTVVKGSAVSLSNAASKTVTSVSLTAGDWDVWGAVTFTGGGTTTVTYLQGGFNTTTNTLGADGPGVCNWGASFANSTPFLYNVNDLPIVPIRVSLSVTTTYFLCAQAAFGTSTCSAYGYILARRVR